MLRDLAREQSMAAEASRSSLLLQALINVRDPQMRTLQEVQQGLKHTNDRVSSMEKHWYQNVPVLPPNSSVHVEADSLSVTVMVYSDEDLVSDSEGLVTALQPPSEVFEPKSGAHKPPDEAEKRPNAPNVSANGGGLYNSDSQHHSWEPKADVTASLEKHFRRKLSYDQASDILDSYSIPSLDCLFSPTLDNSVLNQISPLKSRNYTEKRDKELASVQRSMLNITGPLCCSTRCFMNIQSQMYPKIISN